jgi:anti-sigma factor RsiW
MTICYPPSALRAYLDEELAPGDSAALQSHLSTCAVCQAELDELTALHEQVGRRLTAESDAGLTVDAAWARMRSHLDGLPTGGITPAQRGKLALVLGPRRRPAFAAAAVAAALLAALLVPSVRAAADHLLQIFRAQSVVYISVSPNRVRQIEQLQGNQNALFLSQPTEVGAPQIQQVGSLQQAQSLVGFAPEAPTVLPGGVQSTALEVRGRSEYRVQVNVQTVRQVLAVLGVTDVQIPDALGAQPITATLPPVVHLQYVGPNYTLNLIEGTTPTVNLPAGVDLAQLGKAALEVYGMSPQQAAALSKHIDWDSTLVFPFPTGTSQLQQVDINGATGILLDSQGSGVLRHSSSQQAGSTPAATGAQANGQWQGAVYWQRGGHFYILTGEGSIGNSALLSAASSMR